MKTVHSALVIALGHEVKVQAGEDGIRFLLVSGKPLEEPVAWYGPIVMNTQEQLRQAFNHLERGAFLRHNSQPALDPVPPLNAKTKMPPRSKEISSVFTSTCPLTAICLFGV